MIRRKAGCTYTLTHDEMNKAAETLVQTTKLDAQGTLEGLEATLNDPKKKYPDKVNALLSAWEHVTAFIATAAQDASETLIDWVHRHTLYLVLQGEWPKLSPATKTHLSVTLQRCAGLLSKHSAAPQCRALIGLVKDPWGHPVLHRILNGASDVADSEVLELCQAEKGFLLSMRLEMLCESKCEDLALKLAEAIHRCLRSREGGPEEQLLCTVDIYMVLLYKFKKIHDIIKELKHFDLKEGLLLIRRYSIKNGKRARVWKYSAKVADLAAQYFLTVAMVKPVGETGTLLQDLMIEWARLHSDSVSQTLPNMIRKLIQPAGSAVHIYIFCQVLVNQFGDALKSLCIELYIRGLTTDMNELEQQKMKNDKEKVREAEVRLSDGFLKLADLVKDNVGVCRECVLTAFSLNPTRMCYERIKEMAVASGKCLCLPAQVNAVDAEDKRRLSESNLASTRPEGVELSCTCVEGHSETIQVDTGQTLIVPNERFSDNIVDSQDDDLSSNISHYTPDDNISELNSIRKRCNLHPPFDPSSGGPLGELCPQCGEFTGIESDQSGLPKKERTLDALILIKGNTVTESLNYDVLSAPNQVLDAETLGLTPQLCDDLAVVLSSPRYQMLSWVLDWNELKLMCEKYLENGEEMRNTTKELKFLNIDYNQFKDWPSGDDEKDEYCGIEKGYEQWADLSSDTSEEFYNRSYKRRARRIQVDSDSDSSLPPRPHARSRKVHRIDSSDSDFDSNQGKDKIKHKSYARALSISDTDTGTQDSRTDSFGSDGYRIEKPTKREKNGRNQKASSGNGVKKKLKGISRFHVMVTDDLNQGDLTSDFSNRDVMNIFSQIGGNGKEVPSTQFSSIPQINSMLNTDKRSSDPSVVKTLRMFRPHNAKSNPRDSFSQVLHGKNESPAPDYKGVAYSKFAPMLSTLNLNPRIVLTRTDVANQDFKTSRVLIDPSNIPRNPLSQISPDILSTKSSQNRNLPYDIDNKNQIPIASSFSVDLEKHEYIKSNLLVKNVPGLNSLDMIVPPPSQATVQVVQFPRNMPSTSKTSRGTSQHPPKTTNTQNLQNSGSLLGSNAGHQDQESSTNAANISQSQASNTNASSSVDAVNPDMQTTATQSCSTTLHGQVKSVKLNSQSEVKYLTTTSEVNEILRSTLSESNLQTHTTQQIATSVSANKQKAHPRQDLSYLTSSSEPSEVLRNTNSDTIHQSQAVSSASSQNSSVFDFTSQSKIKMNSRSDVRYLTSPTEVNEILKNSHIVQKTGQTQVTMDASVTPAVQNVSHQVNNSHQLNPVSPFPVVKGVDLNVIASIISSKNCANSVPSSQDSSPSTSDSQMLQLVCKGRKFQLKPVICTQTSPKNVAAENSETPAVATASSLSNEQQQQQTVVKQQLQQQQKQASSCSTFEEDFEEFPATTGLPTKEKGSPSKETKNSNSYIASLPKFQQAFGKSIYNQSSSTLEEGSHIATVRESEDEDESPRETLTSESTETVSQVTTVPSTVLSKAVQTSMASIVSHPTPAGILQNEQHSNADGIPSTVPVNNTASVFSILQGSPRIAVSAALRVGGGMTVQAIQTSTGIIYMHPDASSLVNSGAGVALASAIPARRNSSMKTTETSETVQQARLADGLPSSVAVAIATPSIPVLAREAVKRRMLPSSVQNPHNSPTVSGSGNRTSSTSQLQEPEVCVVESSSDEEVNSTSTQQQTLVTSAAIHKVMPVQKSVGRQMVTATRHIRPVTHIPGGGNITSRSTTNITSLRQQGVQSVLVSPVSSASNSRIVQNVGSSETMISHGSIEPTVSSTTLEQLREFESVLEQVTNTSQMKERSTVQTQSQTQHTVLAQQMLLTQAVTSTTNSDMEFTSCTESQTSTSFSQDLYSVASTTGAAVATARVNVTYVTQASSVRTTSIVPVAGVVGGSVTGKMTSPVVVVTSYCQPVASPALSVTSQSSSSPCVTPAPASTSSSGKSPPKSSKSSKSKSVKSGTATTASKSSPVPKPQQKPQEDEQTAQRIYAILDEYAEQLRNSPDLNNKPAPRRRSNPPTNANQSSKRKKSAQTKVKLLGQQSSSSVQELSPGADDPRTMGSEDSSSGITQLSQIQDSPAPSSQNADEPLSLRATPSMELSAEAGTLRSVSDTGELQDVSKQQEQHTQDQTHEKERNEGQQSPVHLSSQHGLLFTDSTGSIQGRTVIVQDSVSSSVDAAVSGNGSVVTGKPVMMGNSAAMPALFAGVRQVIVPVAPGLTASVQARPVVVSSKGSKVIRVHQVTVPGGSIQMAPGMSAMQGAALVVRQINKPGIPVGTVAAPVSVLGQPTVKQVKLPVGSISSQALSGVTAQPPVVLPPGSHHITGQLGSVVTSTIAHALSFPESSIENVLQDGSIRTESSNIIGSGETLLLNAGTASQAIGFIRRGIPASFHERISTSVGGVITNASAAGSSAISVDRVTYPSVRQVSSLNIESDIISLNSPNSNSVREQLSGNNESSLSCDRDSTNPECQTSSSSSRTPNVQCVGVDFSSRSTVENSEFRNRLVQDKQTNVTDTKASIENCILSSECIKKEVVHSPISSLVVKTETVEETSGAGQLESNIKTEVHESSHFDIACVEHSRQSQHSNSSCQTSRSPVLQVSSSAERCDDQTVFQPSAVSGCTNALNDRVLLQDRTSGTSEDATARGGNNGQGSTSSSTSSSSAVHLHFVESVHNRKQCGMPENNDSSSSSSSTSSSSSSSSTSTSSSNSSNSADSGGSGPSTTGNGHGNGDGGGGSNNSGGNNGNSNGGGGDDSGNCGGSAGGGSTGAGSGTGGSSSGSSGNGGGSNCSGGSRSGGGGSGGGASGPTGAGNGSSTSSTSSDVMNIANSCSKVLINCKQREKNLRSHNSSVEGKIHGMQKLCRTNTTQTSDYALRSGNRTEVGTYTLATKPSNHSELVNDVAFRLSAKLASEKHDSPWRYVPVVKRVRVSIQPTMIQKDECSLVAEHVGSALNLSGREVTSETEDHSQDRRSFLSDAKFVSVGRKTNVTGSSHVHTNASGTYGKLGSETEEKRGIEKLEHAEMQQKMTRLERELRLQKSLSEECEDLGVDEPSTSELFPEADLLLDPNSSPGFEQTIQDASCSQASDNAESYSGSNFRQEYSSSSQEESHFESQHTDNHIQEVTEHRKEIRSYGSKKSYSDWKCRSASKEHNKCNMSIGILHNVKLSSQSDVGLLKINSSGESCSFNSGSKNVMQRNKLGETLNRSSKPNVNRAISTCLVLESPSAAHSDKLTKKEGLLNDNQKFTERSNSAKSFNSKTVPSSMDAAIEELQKSNLKHISSRVLSVTDQSNIEPKVDLPVTSSSSEDSVTLDSFTTSIVASSLDITIPSPVPNTLSSMPPTQLLENTLSRDPIPSLTAAQKFTYTYGKKLSSSRQDVCRVIKRARLNRPNQYFNEHVDSQETWDSSSSQEKTGGDEDSEEMSPSSQMSSQQDDGANTDVDVVEISNDESSSSAALAPIQSPSFPLLPSVGDKVTVSTSSDGLMLKSCSTNGLDTVCGKSATNSGKKLSVKRSRTDKRFFNSDAMQKESAGDDPSESFKEGDDFHHNCSLREKRYRSIHSPSKINVPTKEQSASVTSPFERNYKKQQGLRSRQQGGKDSCGDTCINTFPLVLTPASMTDTDIDMMPSSNQGVRSDEDTVSKLHFDDKDECPIGGTCETHLKPTRSSRRRGHIKKCQCCCGSPERPKKKKLIGKVEKHIKKGQSIKQLSKTSVSKKR